MTSMRIPAGLYFHGAEAVPAPLASLDDAPHDAAAINFRRIRRYRGGLSPLARTTGRRVTARAVEASAARSFMSPDAHPAIRIVHRYGVCDVRHVVRAGIGSATDLWRCCDG